MPTNQTKEDGNRHTILSLQHHNRKLLRRLWEQIGSSILDSPTAEICHRQQRRVKWAHWECDWKPARSANLIYTCLAGTHEETPWDRTCSEPERKNSLFRGKCCFHSGCLSNFFAPKFVTFWNSSGVAFQGTMRNDFSETSTSISAVLLLLLIKSRNLISSPSISGWKYVYFLLKIHLDHQNWELPECRVFFQALLWKTNWLRSYQLSLSGQVHFCFDASKVQDFPKRGRHSFRQKPMSCGFYGSFYWSGIVQCLNKKQCRDSMGVTSPITCFWRTKFGEHEPPPGGEWRMENMSPTPCGEWRCWPPPRNHPTYAGLPAVTTKVRLPYGTWRRTTNTLFHKMHRREQHKTGGDKCVRRKPLQQDLDYRCAAIGGSEFCSSVLPNKGIIVSAFLTWQN